MDYETIIYTKEKAIATITLNRPAKMNAINHAMANDLVAAIEDAGMDETIRVLVITGAGRGFCSGGDQNMKLPFSQSYLNTVMHQRIACYRVPLALRQLDKVTIASINGPAVAGGLTYALACDLRVASDRATFGETSIKLGFIPDEGGTYFLPRVVGIEKALELILLGDIIDAKQALAIGLVGRVVPHEELQSATRELATRLAEGPPIAQRLAKMAVYKQLHMDLWASLEELALGAQIVNSSEDTIEGKKAFLEKRKPLFKGR